MHLVFINHFSPPVGRKECEEWPEEISKVFIEGGPVGAGISVAETSCISSPVRWWVVLLLAKVEI
jgi:hypothetical protein